MALIKCPECGKENVSDSAESCPNCGYGIKAHFEKIRKQEFEQELYKKELDNVKMPEKPKRMNVPYGLAIFFVFGGIFTFITSLTLGLILIIFAGWMFFEGEKQYEKEMSKYNLAKSDFEKYQKEIVREQDREARIEASKMKCPQCGSTNIKRISITSRTISVATAGLASGKIGKQYKCNRCKYMW